MHIIGIVQFLVIQNWSPPSVLHRLDARNGFSLQHFSEYFIEFFKMCQKMYAKGTGRCVIIHIEIGIPQSHWL